MLKKRYPLFIENCAQDLFFFLFFLLLLSVYRFSFLAVFQHTLTEGTSHHDILLTLWYGLRLSLKTAGGITLIPFVLGTLVQTAWPKWPAAKIRLYWGFVGCVVFALLFQTRLAYYQEFQNAFSPFIFNTLHDDVWAIVQTAITQYQAPWRVLQGLLCAAVTGGILAWGLQKIRTFAKPLLSVRHPLAVMIGIFIAIIPFAVFVRFGGSFNYTHSLYWKNAARMNQHLLNEAILDDVQALYKARKLYKRLTKSSQKITPQQVQQAALQLSGKEITTSLLPALTRTAQGAKIEKPSHIFVIVAETYMLWPLLEPYQNLPIAQGMRALLAQPNAILADKFISASNGTMFGLTSVLLGMPELNLFTANRPTALEPYETALSTQLKKQGYQTRFFYGGYPSWDGLGEFISHQNFDESFYLSDLGDKGGVWGMEDKQLFRAVEQHTDTTPSFTLILTVTNHPPYTVDMTKEPLVTPADKMEAFLPPESDKKMMVERMQHFEYADRYLAQFVQTMQQKYPDSLFIITGDHADRWTFTPNPSLYERLAVPLVLIGKGITKNMLPARAAGAHMDIVPTLMELILPKGTTYYALGQDILSPQPSDTAAGLHAYYFITPDLLAETNADSYELLPSGAEPDAESLTRVRERLKNIQTLAAWRILNGTSLEK